MFSVFLKSQKGSVTVFQCLIFTSLLLIAGVLIDTARIMAAERKVQSSLNTAARSALAGYDAELAGGYGLFAVDTKSEGSKISEDFLKYLKMNLNEKHKNYRLINYEVSDLKTDGSKATYIEGMGSLLSDPVYKEQIIEYMKYRAPVTITQGVVEKFMESGLLRKLNFSKSEKNVRSKRVQVDKEVKETNKRLETSKKAINEGSLESLKKACTELEKAKNANGTIKGKLEEHEAARIESDKSADEDNGNLPEKYKTRETENLKNSGGIEKGKEKLDHLSEQSDKLKSSIDRNINKLDRGIKEIENLEEEINRKKGKIRSLQETLGNLRSSLLYPMPEMERDSIKESIEIITNEITQLQEEIKANERKIDDVKNDLKPDGLEKIEIPEAAKEAQPAELNGEKDNKDGVLNKLKSELGKYLKNIEDKNWSISDGEFSDAAGADEERFQEIKKGNAEELDPEISQEKAEEYNNSILKFAESMFSAMKDALSGGMGRLYTVEYVMDKYTYITAITERDHFFRKGEVEYILWGSSSELSNIAKTMSTVMLLRFGIDTIDYFATSKIPHPVARLIAALIQGFARACMDVVELYRGKPVDICPSLNAVRINYADHLRIFLIFQATFKEADQLKNMRRLVQVNILNPEDEGNLTRPEFRLGNYNTMLHAKAEVKINLWFLPVLKPEVLKLKKFDGGKYIIEKEIFMGY